MNAPHTEADQKKIESERKVVEQRARELLDKDAMAVIEESKKAVDAISASNIDEAIKAIERAIGKVDILLARKPPAALIPVNIKAQIIDTAPCDAEAILEIAQDASLAFDEQDFPDARTLLHSLMSEVRVRTFNVPLATYPTALKDAARLLDQKKNEDAKSILLAALTTLVATDYVTPIPLILAREAIQDAQAQASDPEAARKLLETARNELLRARQLGYTARAHEYVSLNDEIDQLQKRLKSNQDTGLGFAALKEKLASILKGQAKRERHSTRS